MMGSGSGHDRRSEPERDLIAEVVDHPGWFERAWATARRARRWIRRKHEPIAEGIETAGRGWTRIARTAARVGRSLSQMGTVIERNGKILSKGRGRGRQIGRNLVTFGGGLRKFGDWLNKTGRSWAPDRGDGRGHRGTHRGVGHQPAAGGGIGSATAGG